MARLFELIETPEPGWRVRKLKWVEHIGAPGEWLVQLMKVGTGITVEHRSEHLHVAFTRSQEAAHNHEIGLDKVDPPFELDAEHEAEVERIVRETGEAEARAIAKVNGSATE